MNLKIGYSQEEIDDLDEAIQDTISDDEGSLSPLTLLHHLYKRGWAVLPVNAVLDEEVKQ